MAMANALRMDERGGRVEVDQKQFSRDVMAKLLRGGIDLALTRDGDPKTPVQRGRLVAFRTEKSDRRREKPGGSQARNHQNRGVRRIKRSG
jgi:hypothetical protein